MSERPDSSMKDVDPNVEFVISAPGTLDTRIRDLHHGFKTLGCKNVGHRNQEKRKLLMGIW